MLFRSDLIDYNGAAAAGAPNYQNIAKATANGEELEIHGGAVGGFTGDLSVTWLATKVVDRGFDPSATATLVQGQRLLRRPATSGSFRLGYVGIDRLKLGAVATYVGDRDDRDFSAFPAKAVTLKAYALYDLSGEYALPAGGAKNPEYAVTLRLANLTDVIYQSVQGYKAPGRTILAGVRVAK